jgi:hypothetical protein
MGANCLPYDTGGGNDGEQSAFAGRSFTGRII